MQGRVGCYEEELSGQVERHTWTKRSLPVWRTSESLCLRGCKKCVLQGLSPEESGSRKQASWAEKWLLPERVEWGTQVLLYLFRQGFSKPSPLCENQAIKGRMPHRLT